jgi:single-stranded-DNA-specific exonuclease
MQPTGYGNSQASFVSRYLKPTRYRTVGKDNTHLKLSVSDGRITFDAIAFRLGEWANRMPHKIDILYRFELNEFNGRKTLQLNIQDIRSSV